MSGALCRGMRRLSDDYNSNIETLTPTFGVFGCGFSYIFAICHINCAQIVSAASLFCKIIMIMPLIVVPSIQKESRGLQLVLNQFSKTRRKIYLCNRGLNRHLVTKCMNMSHKCSHSALGGAVIVLSRWCCHYVTTATNGSYFQ